MERLTGEGAIDHYSAAGFGPLYDVERQDWSDELARDIAPRAMLPRLGWTTEVAGRLTDRAAAATGLAPARRWRSAPSTPPPRR